MTIQIIGKNWGRRTGFDGITQSPLSSPRSLDEFDVNIISLNDDELWENNEISYNSINNINDLRSIAGMVKNRMKSIVVYVMPQNFNFDYHKNNSGHPPHYFKHMRIKDALQIVWDKIIDEILYPKIRINPLSYENTRTTIGQKEYPADFYFSFHEEKTILTKSNASEKPTTVLLCEKTLMTTLNITTEREGVLNFIEHLLSSKNKTPVPEWVLKIQFGDDSKQHTIIAEKEEIIKKAQSAIYEANQKLKENEKYKSILYTNGNELVSVVFQILEKILNCDLSGFHDEKREDFLIKLPKYTFIGEIKGVTSNVKYEHISQLELHYRSYLDDLEEEKSTETVKQLLIINPFRTKPLNEREPVHSAQIDLAIRNNCLIIETDTLLRVFEKFCNKEINVRQCQDVFASKTGLLRPEDFNPNGK